MIWIESGSSRNIELSLCSCIFSAAFILMRRHMLSTQFAGSRVRARYNRWYASFTNVLYSRHSSWPIHRSTVPEHGGNATRRQSEVVRFRTLIFACARACNPLTFNSWVSLIRSVRSELPLCLNRRQFVITCGAKNALRFSISVRRRYWFTFIIMIFLGYPFNLCNNEI